jgi:hypothetical protein
MSEYPATPIQRMAGPVYFLAFLFLLQPLADYVSNVWPMNFGSVTWRYGAMGLTSGFLLTPLLGLVIFMITAGYLEHRGIRILTGVVSAALAIALLLGTMLFVLDSLQVRRGASDAGRLSFDIGFAKAALKIVTGAICCAWIGLVSLTKLPAAAKSRRAEPRPLVVGASESGGKVPGAGA